ncbi:hypothetical protein ACH40F_17895 [Streptomyces sp. NPDC020794]
MRIVNRGHGRDKERFPAMGMPHLGEGTLDLLAEAVGVRHR